MTQSADGSSAATKAATRLDCRALLHALSCNLVRVAVLLIRKPEADAMSHRIVSLSLGLVLAVTLPSSAHAAVILFNSSDSASSDSTRADWLAAYSVRRGR